MQLRITNLLSNSINSTLVISWFSRLLTENGITPKYVNNLDSDIAIAEHGIQHQLLLYTGAFPILNDGATAVLGSYGVYHNIKNVNTNAIWWPLPACHLDVKPSRMIFRDHVGKHIFVLAGDSTDAIISAIERYRQSFSNDDRTKLVVLDVDNLVNMQRIAESCYENGAILTQGLTPSTAVMAVKSADCYVSRFTGVDCLARVAMADGIPVISADLQAYTQSLHYRRATPAACRTSLAELLLACPALNPLKALAHIQRNRSSV